MIATSVSTGTFQADVLAMVVGLVSISWSIRRRDSWAAPVFALAAILAVAYGNLLA